MARVWSGRLVRESHAVHRHMTTYVLLPGAGGESWYWHLVAPLLRDAGHEAIAVDLPAADDSAGLADYADAIVAAAGDRPRVTLVAQSMAAFSAAMACV